MVLGFFPPYVYSAIPWFDKDKNNPIELFLKKSGKSQIRILFSWRNNGTDRSAIFFFVFSWNGFSHYDV